MKTLFSKKRILELAVIAIIGLIPLLWFQGDKIVLGHDAGLTLSPVTHFQDRLHAWTNRFGYGGDQTYAISGFFIHGLEALVSSLGANNQAVQKVTFIFWFVLPGFAMYYLAGYLEQKLKIQHFVIPASVLYMVNHFLLQGWFVAERTKFSLYAALPIILTLLFKWQDRSVSTTRAGILIAITLFFLNGMGSLPLFGGLIICVAVFSLFYLNENRTLKAITQFIALLATVTGSSLLLNAYWLIPYANYLSGSFSNSVEFFGGIAGILEWLKYLSQHSSFANIFILQGIPEWYQNPDHPYAAAFLSNPILVFVAGLIPIAAVAPLLIEKDPNTKKTIVFFLVVALVAMIFIAGSHPPFGLFYTLLFKYVPGFIAFRSPFYKFSPALLLSYSVLVGYTIQHIRVLLSKKNRHLGISVYAGIICCIVLYSFPFLNGSFFDYIKNTRSMRVAVPDYVYKFEKWATKKENQNKRILVFPPPNIDNKVDAYNWGYWSLAPLTTLLANNQIINESGYMSKNELAMTRKLYQLIEENDSSWIKLAKFLKIDTLLIRYDFAWNLKGSPTKNPQDYEQFLRSANLEKTNEFGAWHLYTVLPSTQASSDISLLNSIALFSGEDISSIASLPVFDPEQAILIEENSKKVDSQVTDAITTNYIKPKCVMCDQQWTYTNYSDYIPLLRRGSFLYPVVKFQEAQAEAKANQNIEALIDLHAKRSLSSILGYRKAIDENEPSTLLERMLDDHYANLAKFKESVDRYTEDYKFDNDKLLDIARLARAQRLVILEEIASAPKNWNSNTEPIIAALQKNFFQFDEIQTKIENTVWRSPNNTKKRFFVNITSDADFKLLYKPNVREYRTTPYDLSIDGEKLSLTPTQAESGWLNLGSLKIAKGDHRIEIDQPLINEYSGEPQLNVRSEYPGSCFQLGKIKGKKNDMYRLTFQYLRISGRKDFSVDFVNEENRSNQFKGIETLNRESFEDQFSHDFIVTDRKESTFVLCNRPGASDTLAQSTVLVKDIVIEKLNVPELVLYSQTKPTESSLTLTGAERNQSNYNINFQGESKNQVLVLNQSYSENWQTSSNAIKFKVNGYANGWLLPANQKNIQIEYTTERLVKLGFIISGLSLGLLMGILVYTKKYEK